MLWKLGTAELHLSHTAQHGSKLEKINSAPCSGLMPGPFSASSLQGSSLWSMVLENPLLGSTL